MLKNAFVRLVAQDGKKETELIRFELGGGDPSDTALLMCKLTRTKDDIWMMKAIGYGTQGRMYTDNVSDCQKELAGRLQMKGRFSYRPAPPPKPTKQEGPALLTILLFVFIIFMIFSYKTSNYTSNRR